MQSTYIQCQYPYPAPPTNQSDILYAYLINLAV